MKKQVLEITLKKTSGAATSEDLKSEPVPEGQIWAIQSGSLRDVTTACTKFQVLIARGTELEPQEEQASPPADTLFWLDREYHLEEGEQIVARFTGSTSGDQLEAYFRGYREMVTPSQGGG